LIGSAPPAAALSHDVRIQFVTASATIRMSACEDSRAVEGICAAKTPPGASAALSSSISVGSIR